MSPRLKSLSVTNFRSIRGTVDVRLDAPIVLIHGQNGAGKTSLLSALEFGLTGTIPSLERIESDYVAHLVHKLAETGRVRVETTATANTVSDFVVSREMGAVNSILPSNLRGLFSERCYLAQSTLGRLLEIYQHQDAGSSDSPLTKFVKELLHLDRFDSLIDGLHTAGDVRRLREPVPVYWYVRDELPKLV